MYPALLQDWLTVRGATTVTTFTQSPAQWLDLGEFQDVVTWLDVKEFTPSGSKLSIAYQTAPTQDEALFVPMAAQVPLTVGLTITTMLKDVALVPLARFLRWQLVLSGTAVAWDATFRLYITANRIGQR